MNIVLSIFRIIGIVLKLPIICIKWLHDKFYDSLTDNGRDIYHSIEYIIVQKLGSFMLLTIIVTFSGILVNDMKLIDLEKELAIWKNSRFALWPMYILIAFTLYDSFRMYKRLRRSDRAYETRKYTHQEVVVKRMILFYKRKADYEKIKIDIMKSFSPVPIVLLFIKDILAYFTVLDIVSMDRITGVVLIGIILYALYFISFWDNYKIYTRNLEEFENELLSLGIDNVYAKKEDEIPKNFDFKRHLYNQPRSIFKENEPED